MINILCMTGTDELLVNMIPFQGDLKRRTDKDINALCESLENDGLVMPFALWEHEGQRLILDGHGRREALIRLALKDPAILEYRFPIILITAADEQSARKSLLQISSTYGKVSKEGLIHFTATIPTYKAPIIKIPTQATPLKTPKMDDSRVIIRLKVDKETAPQLMQILKDVEGVEIF